MSDPKPQIVQEFSTFWKLRETKPVRYTLSVDAKNKSLIDKLAEDDWQASKDAWARYFLLIGQHTPPIDVTTSPPWQARLQELVSQTSAPNADMLVIDRQILKRQHDPGITNFLADPAKHCPPLLSAHVQKVVPYVGKNLPFPADEIVAVVGECASKPMDLLKGFDFARPNRVKTYAERLLRSKIIEFFQQQDVEERTRKSSDHALLKRMSGKKLKEALTVEGFSPAEIERHYQLWQCYQEIYQPRQQNFGTRLEPPTRQQWQQIADRYAQRVQSEPTETLSIRSVQDRMQRAVQAIRYYHSSKSIQERLYYANPYHNDAVDSSDIPVGIIEQAITQLDPLTQTALKLWLGLGLEQGQIVELLGDRLGIKNQYEISRKILKPLLKSLIEAVAQNHADRLPTKKFRDQEIAQLQPLLKAYLKDIYAPIFYAPLTDHWQTLTPDQRLTAISELQPSPELQASLNQWIRKNLEIDLSICPATAPSIIAFITAWLQDQTQPPQTV